MASVFRLADVAQTAGTIVDFKSGTLKAVGRTWQTGTPASTNAYRYSPFGALRAFDHFNLRGERFQIVGSETVANLLTAEKKIENALETARLYHTDPFENTSWWLEANANGEDARRTLIYDGSVEFLTRPGADPHMTYGNMWGDVSLVRHPLWETIAQDGFDPGTISCWGGKWVTTSVTEGTVPARLNRVNLAGAVGGNDVAITQLWAGIREEYTGISHYNAIWDFGAGCTYTNNTVDSGTYATTTISSSPTMLKRITKTLYAHDATYYGEYYGRYLVLLRCKVSPSTVVAVKIKKGFVDSHAVTSNEPVYVSNSDHYMLVEVGEVMIPPVGRWYGDATSGIKYFQIELWAERITACGGTDYLYSDGLCLIPSRHMLSVNNISVNASDVAHYLAVVVKPTDEVIIFQSSGTGRDFGVDGSTRDWCMPAGNSMLVLAAQRVDEHDTSDELDVALYHYPRWQAYRKDAV